MKRTPIFIVAVLIAELAGCSTAGTSSLTPTQSAPSVGAPYASTGSASFSWMSPVAAKAQSLLYVSNLYKNDVGVYSYDAGKNLELVGSLKVPDPTGVCSDKDGHIWIASAHPHSIREFAHAGTKQLFIIRFGFAGILGGCAVDPTSGDLAVAITKDDVRFVGHYGAVWVFPPGSNRGQEYRSSQGFYSVSFPAYDNNGNLFVDGTVCRVYYYCYTAPDAPPGLFELSRGGTYFAQLTLKGVSFNVPAGLAWINPTLLVAENNQNDNDKVVGYKMLVSGGNATLVQTLPFKGAKSVSGIAERAGVAIVTDPFRGVVSTYSIVNGNPIDAILKGLDSPYAAAVSQAKTKGT
jgi:hypothetical protein